MIIKFKIFENKKPFYDPIEIKHFIDWFVDANKDKMEEEGWLISYASLDIPSYYNNLQYSNHRGEFWQIQKDDESEILETDGDAERIAKKHRIMFDEYGIVIGYDDISFFEHPESLNIYKDIRKYNL